MKSDYALTVPALASLLLTAHSTSAASAEAAAQATEELEPILITAQRQTRVSRGATGLDLPLKETPQSISIVPAELMQDFGADSLNEALRLAPGINVEQWETNRTNYMARGFEIKNTQIDGIGLPNDWGIVTGAMDSFGYEKLEVIRGANGLLTGVGNASGTINYVRKRPTNQRRGQLNVAAGSWESRRVEADYSTPLTASGTWAARGGVAWDDRHSWVRDLADDRVFLFSVIDGQLGERTTLTVGHSFQRADTDGNMWGGLSFDQTDGTQAEFGRDASTTVDWTYWDTRDQTAFLELSHALNERWTLRASYNFRDHREDEQLFYAFTVTGLDPATGLGLMGYPGKFHGTARAHLGDITVSGSFDAAGRRHEAMLGYSHAHSDNRLDAWPILNDPETGDPDPFAPLPAFPYAGDVVAEPIWGPRFDYSHYGQWQRRLYGATRLTLTNRLKAVAGFNLVRFHRQGINDSREWWQQTEEQLSPYAGLTFDVTDRVLLYGSYSDIYQPQDQYDIHRVYLEASKGVNVELGAKADWWGGRLLTSAAWFSAKQKGLATFAGVEDGLYYYEGVDVESKGIELEASGRIGERTQLVLGLTSLRLEDPQGQRIYPWVPRRTATLALSTGFEHLPQLRIGASGRWQSGTSKQATYTLQPIRQKAYAVLNLFGQWQLTPSMSLRANVNNITDQKYIQSLYQIGYYGAPRNWSLGLDWRF